jgi:hypothetical protein
MVVGTKSISAMHRSASNHASDETVEIFVEADFETHAEEPRFVLLNIPRHLFSEASGKAARRPSTTSLPKRVDRRSAFGVIGPECVGRAVETIPTAPPRWSRLDLCPGRTLSPCLS